MQNPLESYRRTQRELRRNFDEFTRANCPACPTPCCIRPARILPTDILLAEATGWRAKRPEAPAETEADPVAEVAGRMAAALHDPPESAEATPDAAPCEFLGPQGCTFPTDLRPLGCTTYICRYMYAKLDRRTLARIKRLARELEDKHTVLLRSLRPVSWRKEE